MNILEQQNDNSIETKYWTSFEIDCTLINYAHLNLFKPTIIMQDVVRINSMLQLIYDTCIDNGFAMLFIRTFLMPCEQLVYSLLNIETLCVENMETSLVDIAKSKQLLVIGKRKYSNLFSIVLLRKIASDICRRQPYVNIDINNYEHWIEETEKQS